MTMDLMADLILMKMILIIQGLSKKNLTPSILYGVWGFVLIALMVIGSIIAVALPIIFIDSIN